jgi:hypothetical protein
MLLFGRDISNRGRKKNVPRPCQSFPRSIETGAEFLLTDLDLALTFMDVAATSGVEETKERNSRKRHPRLPYRFALSSTLVDRCGATPRD